MGRIARTPDNLFTMPKGSYVRNKSYVYVNVSNRYVAPDKKKNDKSHPGMDKIGVSTEAAMHGKGFIWFVASILHALMFNGTSRLRASDRKNYTVPAMVDQLEAIKADRDLAKDRRKRRYKLTRRQQNILSCFGVNEADIDERIASIRD